MFVCLYFSLSLSFGSLDLKLFFDNILFESLLLCNFGIINVNTIWILILIIVAIFIIVVLATFFFLLRISLFIFPTSNGLDIEKTLVISSSWKLLSHDVLPKQLLQYIETLSSVVTEYRS
jgi:hypothetical protein